MQMYYKFNDKRQYLTFFFFQAEDGIRDFHVTGVQTCALPISPHATVTFPEGEVELLLRRRGRAVLLTVLALTRPSRVLARDVEVELDALAAAALDASAALCRELAELLPGAEAREARPLRAAARALRRTEEGAPPGPPRPARRAREPRRVRRSAPVSCVLEPRSGRPPSYPAARPSSSYA